MVFSASAPTAYNVYNDVSHILKNQLVFALIGFAGHVHGSKLRIPQAV
jgi:cell division protein FtsW (lipid II flippase)